MFCARCGTENAANAAFCLKCGQPLGEPASPAPPVNPVPPQSASHTAAIRGTLSSVWYLVGVIALSVTVIGTLSSFLLRLVFIPLLNTVMPRLWAWLASWIPQLRGMETYYRGEAISVVISIFFTLLSVGICAVKAAAHWMTYCGARSRADESLLTRGLKLLKTMLLVHAGFTALQTIVTTVRSVSALMRAGTVTTWVSYGIRSNNPFLFVVHILQNLAETGLLVALCILLFILITDVIRALRDGTPIRPVSIFPFIALCVLSFFALVDGTLALAVAYAAFAVAYFLFRRKTALAA